MKPSPLKRFPIKDAATRASSRSPGYLDALLERATIHREDATFSLPTEDFDFLRNHFQGGRIERNSPEYRRFFDAVDGAKIGLPAPHSLPSLTRMAASASRALADEARSVFSAPISQEEIAQRLSICHACPYFTANSDSAELLTSENHRCVLCGCFLALKSRLRSSHCPAGKW